MKRSLIIGRFQPFHIGHLSLMRYALSVSDELIIIIGSANKSHTIINPFTIEERNEMMNLIIKEEFFEKPVYINNISDFSKDEEWFSQLKNLVPEFDVFVSGNNPGYKTMQKIFEHQNISVSILKNSINIDASWIREELKNGKKNITQFLHISTVRYLEKINGTQRIKNSNKNDIKLTQ